MLRVSSLKKGDGMALVGFLLALLEGLRDVSGALGGD